jgi:transcription initiation factor TFIIH subunit 3
LLTIKFESSKIRFAAIFKPPFKAFTTITITTGNVSSYETTIAMHVSPDSCRLHYPQQAATEASSSKTIMVTSTTGTASSSSKNSSSNKKKPAKKAAANAAGVGKSKNASTTAAAAASSGSSKKKSGGGAAAAGKSKTNGSSKIKGGGAIAPVAAGGSVGGGGAGKSVGAADGTTSRRKQKSNIGSSSSSRLAVAHAAQAAANANANNTSSRSLLVIVLDVSPLAWGERDYMRSAQDKARAAKNKSSVGPVTLEEVMNAMQAFGTCFLTLERGQSALLILGVADNETAILYPRKNALHAGLELSSEGASTASSTMSSFETNRLQHDFTMGVAELVSRASKKAEQALQTLLAMEEAVATAATTNTTATAAATTEQQHPPNATTNTNQAAMAAGFSKALCVVNRFLVASNAPGAISALHRDGIIPNNSAPSSEYSQGVLALVNDSGSSDKKKSSSAAASSNAVAVGSWSPRILLVQASDDRSRDYNAMMNCAFCSVKHHVTVDACFLGTGAKNHASSSPFLEQVCDLTGGVFLAPSGAAQIGGCLTEVLLSVFLPPLSCRPLLHLPALNKVDFRSRCFETAEIVNMAHVCNQCLSIFANKPGANTGGRCPTCHARILGCPAPPAATAASSSSTTTTNSNKRFKES